eukprot:2484438-Rhodomonas_salina.1
MAGEVSWEDVDDVKEIIADIRDPDCDMRWYALLLTLEADWFRANRVCSSLRLVFCVGDAELLCRRAGSFSVGGEKVCVLPVVSGGSVGDGEGTSLDPPQFHHLVAGGGGRRRARGALGGPHTGQN